MQILIVKISAIGDVIMTLPVVTAFRKSLPDVEIDWVTGEAAWGVLEGNPFIRRAIVYPQKAMLSKLGRPLSWPGILSTSFNFLKELRRERYDLVIDFQGLLKSGFITGCSRADTRSGFAGGREGSSLFLNHRLPPYNPDEHAVDRYLRLAASHGADIRQPVEFVLGINDNERKVADETLKRVGIGEGERFLALVPGTVWDTKRWTASGFAAVADMVAEKSGIPSIITGALSDKILAREIISRSTTKPADLTGSTPLRPLAEIYRRSSAVVSVDTGPMHLAVAAGARVAALFGPTAPWRTGPYGTGHKVIVSGADCAPCFRRSCDSCQCMTGITPEMVMNALEDLLL